MKFEESQTKDLNFKNYQDVLDYGIKYIISNQDMILFLDVQMSKDVLTYLSLDTSYKITGNFNDYKDNKIIMIARIGNEILIGNAYDPITGKLVFDISAKCIFILKSLKITKKQINAMDRGEMVIIDDTELSKVKKHTNKKIHITNDISNKTNPIPPSEMITNYITDDGFGNDHCENYYKLDPNIINELLGDIDIQKENLIEDIVNEYTELILKIRFTKDEINYLLLELIDDILEIKDKCDNQEDK